MNDAKTGNRKREDLNTYYPIYITILYIYYLSYTYYFSTHPILSYYPIHAFKMCLPALE